VRLHVLEDYYPTLEQSLQDGSVNIYVGPDLGLKLPLTRNKDNGREGETCCILPQVHRRE
jgi:hypothetical protein